MGNGAHVALLAGPLAARVVLSCHPGTNAMILAHHLILTAYGFWLPNDPRGSWSDFVRSWDLYQHGRATKVSTTRSVAARPHDPQARMRAKDTLQFDPVIFNGLQARAIARGFAWACSEAGYQCWACAIMTDHAHLVMAGHERGIDLIRSHLKARATRQLNDEGLNPLPREHGISPWARKGWTVFLDDDADVRRAIAYVNANPARAGLRPQAWRFVAAYGGHDAANAGRERPR
jgi:REP element-mobilizing transposase RayT